ncbi:unnamed protein product [Trichogramma brassicae]|uniref:C2H2-type domain-containing protein n=1 Tax=Trichogramma brassicae TaxID=86971 RepID=A0A6H5J1D9_9HYME|nr:unnamed protein product [Trichogramma brassicae]
MSAGLLDLQALSKSSEPLENTPMSSWLRSSQPSSPAMVIPPPPVAVITKRIVEAPLMAKDAPVPSLKEFATGSQDEKMIRLEGLIRGLAGYVKDRRKPATQLQRFSSCLTRAFAALQKTMECTEVPSSQEAVVAASTPSSKRKKRPATSPPEVVAAEKRATGPHAHEQVVDANNNAAVSEETFTVVKGRRGRRRDAHQAGEVERGSQPSRPRQRKVRLRPDAIVGEPPYAIVVKAAGTTTYADILRKLYAEPALQETVGKSVQCIRRSASGAMVLQLRKGVQNASALGTELDGVLGDAATASALRHKTALEIRDLDECATKAEICTALGHQLGTTNLDPDVVRSLRKAYAGTQTAVIDLPDELAAEALKLGHLRVGWVSCRVRERAEASRCFRCWEFNHVAARCAGPDRSKLCYRSAQNLLSQTVRELGINVAIVCDQYKNPGPHYTWIADSNRQAAIWVRGGLPVQDRPSRPLPFFTWAPCQRRVHLQRIRSTETLQRRVFRSAGKRGGGGPAQEAPHHCGRFQCLVDGVGQQRETKTPRRRPPRRALCPGRRAAEHRTHADLHRSAGQLHHRPLLRQRLDSLTPRVAGWQVEREVFTNSDHRAITFNLSAHRPHRSSAGPRRRWCARKLDVEAFSEQLSGARIPNANATPGHPEDMAAALITAITEACSVSMPSGGGRRRRHKPVYWWTDEIAALRRQCLRARRLAQRARGRAAEEARLADFAIAKSRLRAAIEESKRRCWSALCNEVDRDVWGRPYGTVMSRLRGPRATPPREPTLVRRTVAALFPTVTEALIRPPAGPAGAVIPGVTLEELRGACTRIRDGAAPGPDGVPNRALKLAVVLRPDAFLRVYSACLSGGVFPSPWKRQRLMCCCRSRAGRLMLLHHTVRCACSTRRARSSRGSYADVWRGTRRPQTAFRITSTDFGEEDRPSTPSSPSPLRPGRRSEARGAAASTAPSSPSTFETRSTRRGGTTSSPRSSEFARPSTCRRSSTATSKPECWNTTPMMARSPVVSRLAFLKARSSARSCGTRAIARVRDALWGLGLETADHKTEALLFSRKRRLETIIIEVGDCFIASSPCIRYLGTQLDARLTFNDHLIAASEKASKVAGALSQIMPTIGGPRSSRRRLYANVIDSILLYGAPIWSCGLGARAGLRRAEAIHRRACLRVISGRPHLSYDATYVLASIPPLALLADERSRLHQRHHEDARAEERQETLRRWQSQWDRSPKGRWTHRLIPNIRSWIERRHGEVDYHLTQLLSGHGYFKHHSQRYDHNASADCPACPLTVENAEHVFFNCPRFEEGREKLHRQLQETRPLRAPPLKRLALLHSSPPCADGQSARSCFLYKRGARPSKRSRLSAAGQSTSTCCVVPACASRPPARAHRLSSSRSRRRALEIHGGRKDYACEKCEQKFGLKSNLIRHQKAVHDGRKDYTCDNCEKKFANKSNLLLHQRTVHEGRQDYACNKCEKKFGRKPHLLRHRREVHEGRKDYACDECGKKFSQNSDLFRHQKSVHEGRKDFACDKCEKKFVEKSKLIRHLKIVHEGRKVYECDNCEKKFGQKSYLLIHQRTVHEGRKDFACDKCEKKFGHKSDLLKHQRTVHEDRKDFACDKCERMFGFKTHLLIHQSAVHEGRRDHACDKCEKKFGIRRTLILHQKTVHEGRKDFACDNCEKKFGYQSDLSKHQRTVHEGRKDYACDKCQQKFGQKSNLDLHQKTVHEGHKDYGCEKCEKKFGQKGNLLRHQRTVH